MFYRNPILRKSRKARYASFDSEKGKAFEEGKLIDGGFEGLCH